MGTPERIGGRYLFSGMRRSSPPRESPSRRRRVLRLVGDIGGFSGEPAPPRVTRRPCCCRLRPRTASGTLEVHTGKTIPTRSTAGGQQAKAELLAAIDKDHNTEASQVVMDIYYTAFVTQ